MLASYLLSDFAGNQKGNHGKPWICNLHPPIFWRQISHPSLLRVFREGCLSAATEHVIFWTFQNLNCKTSQNPSIFIQLYWKWWQIVHSHVWVKRLTRWCLVADQLPSVQANGPWQITEHTEHQWLNGHRIIKWIHFSAPEPRRGLDLFLFENSDTVLPIGWFYVSYHLCPEPEKSIKEMPKTKSRRVRPQK